MSQQPHCQVVGIAVNGQQAIDLAKIYQPDVIILDVRMPVLDGHSAAIQIKQFDPYVRIIAYSSLAKLPMEKIIKVQLLTYTALKIYLPKL
ncbi:MAG UNVERIFIED_CONTAM: response regulator [Microcystis novacekii LVE1205-3]